MASEESFQRAVNYILVDETGEEAKNDPSRAEARFGLFEGQYRLYRGIPIEEASRSEAREVYRLYWEMLHGKELSPPLGYYLLDVAIRFNPGLAERWLRLALGLDQLAVWGQVKTKLEELTTRDIVLLVEVFVRRRLKSDPQWEECKHWWTNRANRSRDRAVKWSRELS